MKTRNVLLALIGILFCMADVAVGQAAEVAASGDLMTSLFVEPWVQNAPFSADVINETTRMGQEGKRVRQETRGRIYRDSKGRTRDEAGVLPNSDPQLRAITIFDPVEKVVIGLQLRSGEAWIGQIPDRTVKLSSPSPASATNPGVWESSGRDETLKYEDLGTKVIEGLTVKGTRRTRTIPAGRTGNEKPVVVITDSWYSPDLGAVILRESDSQSVHRVMRLANIQRTEPDPAMFQVPPHFVVKQGMR